MLIGPAIFRPKEDRQIKADFSPFPRNIFVPAQKLRRYPGLKSSFTSQSSMGDRPERGATSSFACSKRVENKVIRLIFWGDGYKVFKKYFYQDPRVVAASVNDGL
jgi:hypothetical protein